MSQVVGANTNYYQFDRLGSTAGLINAAGIVLNSYSYLPFGASLHVTGTAPNPFTFIGRLGVSADGHGLLNMGARSHDPTTGQFLSNDPIGLGGGDANLRRYAANDPISLSDPHGCSADFNPWGAPSDEAEEFLLEQESLQESQRSQLADVAKYGDILRAREVARDKGLITDNADYQEHELHGVTLEHLEWCLAARANWMDRIKRRMRDLSQGKPADRGIVEALKGGRPLPPESRSPTDSGNTDEAHSVDPNALLGPAGYGVENFVAAVAVLPYEIEFENSTNATAPAQMVTVSDPLDGHLDPSTFQLTEIAFGDTTLTIPAGTQYYENTVSMTYNDRTFDVEVTAGIDRDAAKVFATFQSINPTTGLPPDVLSGFLPPEDGTGRGQGRIRFTIQAREGVPNGTAVRSVALITFDQNDVIATDQIDPADPTKGVDPAKQALVTIDSGTPTSTVAPLPASAPPEVTVSWRGMDDANGSGIAAFDVFVSDNGGPFTPWQTGTTLTSAVFSGEPGHTYGFKSVAKDNVGNVEPVPAAAQATVKIADVRNQVLFDAGVLVAAGTDAADTIALTPVVSGAKATLQVTVNRTVVSKAITLSTIRQIRVLGHAANDTINVGNLAIPVLVEGGAGNDTITLTNLTAAATVDGGTDAGGTDSDKLTIVGQAAKNTFKHAEPHRRQRRRCVRLREWHEIDGQNRRRRRRRRLDQLPGASSTSAGLWAVRVPIRWSARTRRMSGLSPPTMPAS